MLKLPDVTLVVIDDIDSKRAIKSLKKSLSTGIEFGEVKFIASTRPPDKLIKNTPIKFSYCEPIKSIEDYSKFCIKDLSSYFNTTHVLVSQYDSWVVNPLAWTDEFLNFDYIGSVWWWWHAGLNPGIGNGGFSLRSKKLQELVQQKSIENPEISCHNEDNFICFYAKKWLIEQGCKWPSLLLAERFSVESRPYCGSFGHHNGHF